MAKKEPSFGYRNLIKARKDGKIKGYFNLLIPTESIGTIELSGFKVISGEKGFFISLPNRAVETVKKQAVQTAAGTVEGTVKETKYFNNIRFESQERYNEFRKALNEEVLPLIVSELSK
jgi:hypothetical protein